MVAESSEPYRPIVQTDDCPGCSVIGCFDGPRKVRLLNVQKVIALRPRGREHQENGSRFVSAPRIENFWGITHVVRSLPLAGIYPPLVGGLEPKCREKSTRLIFHNDACLTLNLYLLVAAYVLDVVIPYGLQEPVK